MILVSTPNRPVLLAPGNVDMMSLAAPAFRGDWHYVADLLKNQWLAPELEPSSQADTGPDASFSLHLSFSKPRGAMARGPERHCQEEEAMSYL